MNRRKVFPETELKSVDVLSADGYFNAGCRLSDGKILPALNRAVDNNPVLKNITAAWYAPITGNYIFRNADGYVYFTLTDMGSSSGRKIAGASHSFVEINEAGEPSAVVIGASMYLAIKGAASTLRPFKGGIRSCVLKNGRIFGIDNADSLKIKWSGEGGLEDWTEGISGAGWATLQNGCGEILNLIVYRDKLVAVREYGLAFMSAYGAPENFRLSYLEGSLPKIFKDTAAVAGDKLVFYTEDGLYVYDGSSVKKWNTALAEEMQNPRSVFCARGVYYLCGESKTLKRQAVLVADVNRGYSYILDENLEAVCAGEKIYAYGNGREYLLDGGGEYSFTSGDIDFSSDKEKVLKEVKIDCESDVRLEVSNGVISRIVGGIRGKFRPNMRGKSFKITVSGSGIISRISAVAEVQCGV